jgi:hypothetical protein
MNREWLGDEDDDFEFNSRFIYHVDDNDDGCGSNETRSYCSIRGSTRTQAQVTMQALPAQRTLMQASSPMDAHKLQLSHRTSFATCVQALLLFFMPRISTSYQQFVTPLSAPLQPQLDCLMSLCLDMCYSCVGASAISC